MSKLFKIGDIIRYSNGVSALFRFDGTINANRYYGEHVLGGSHGASDGIFNQLTLASNEDIEFCKRERPDWFKPVHKRLDFKTLTEKNVQRCEEGFGHTLDSWSVAEWTNAIAGEVGEACNIAKKMIRLRDGIKGNAADATLEDYRKKLGRELADSVIYSVLTAARESIDLEAVIIETFNNKSDEIGSNIKL